MKKFAWTLVVAISHFGGYGTSVYNAGTFPTEEACKAAAPALVERYADTILKREVSKTDFDCRRIRVKNHS